MFDARSYIEQWLRDNSVKLTLTGMFDGHPLGKKPGLMADLIWLDYINLRLKMGGDKSGIRPIGQVEFATAMRLFRETALPELRHQFYKPLAFSGTEDLGPLKAYCSAVFGANSSDVAISVLAHHIANVKRKMSGLSTLWHIMPILSGPQGTGKTVAIKQLYSVLGPSFNEMSLSSALNLFTQDFVERYFCVLFDEMAGLDRADVNSLKRLITGEGGIHRKAHQADVSEYTANCSFIGTTNEPVPLLLKDATGARRFFELRVDKETEREMIGMGGVLPSKINYLELWRGIDETRLNRYWENSAVEIRKAQEELAAPDSVTDFLEEYSLKAPGQGDSEFTLLLFPRVFEEFVSWCKNNNYSNYLNKNHFGRKIKAFGIESVRSIVDGKRHTALRFAVGHTLPKERFEGEESILKKLRTGLQVIK